MSIIYGIKCDDCGFEHDDLRTHEKFGGSVDETLRLAMAEGWIRTGKTKRDYCPECVARHPKRGNQP